MRTGHVYYKNQLAGVLSQLDNGSFVFQYDEQWLNDSSKASISLTFPKNKMEFHSSTLFPFFFNLIPEGVNKRLICSKKRIDLDDYFGILLEVAGGDTIGAVKVIKLNDQYGNK
jgi:serine/threonine-protein kinase HipA